MKTINTNASNEDSFKYSILCSLYYYDILHHPDRITKLKHFMNKYNLTHNTPKEFEADNPNISLTLYDENNDIIRTPNNNATNEAKIAKINNHRYPAIKPIKSKSIILNEFIQSHSYHELRDNLFGIILRKIDDIDSIAEEIISPVLFY